jgi:hypothetical protein
MNALSAETLLRVWEENFPLHPIQRSLALLAAAWPERSAAEWGRASVGQRDTCLLALREALFGSELQTTTACPRCGERLESIFHTHQIRVGIPTLPSAPAELCLHEQEFEIRYRLPTSEDLLVLTAEPARMSGGAALLDRCVQKVWRHGAECQRGELSPEVVALLTEEIARHDCDAHIEIGLTCPVCRHTWSATFDIVSYLWSEIGDWAARLLQDVHVLASAYGWHERDILALSATRRRLYLELAQS